MKKNKNKSESEGNGGVMTVVLYNKQQNESIREM